MSFIKKIEDQSILPLFSDKLKSLFSTMDKKYSEAENFYDFKCTGCTDNCCFTRFYHHTFLEYFFILQGFSSLEDSFRTKIAKKASDNCAKRKEADLQGEKIRLLCPLNIDELCILYEYRPMICRLHGIPHELNMPKTGVTYGSGCNFFDKKCRQKEYFKFDRTPFYIRMARLENEFKQAADINGKFKMTIAQIIADF